MGQHYIPQYYLKGFSVNSGKCIWVYDKQGTLSPFATSPKNIAQEKTFYSPEVETYLANEIEYPANKVLAKIRDRKRISGEEKAVLAKYIAVMMRRVPGGKERCEQLLEIVLHEQSQKMDQELREICRSFVEDHPKDFWLETIIPEGKPSVLDLLQRMVWRFFTTSEESTFLTSDNPVSYFKFLGLGHPECEVTFPVSSRTVLWLTWRNDLSEGHFPATNQIVKEINRRTVSNAKRYAYHHVYKDWIQPFVTKRKHERYKIY